VESIVLAVTEIVEDVNGAGGHAEAGKGDECGQENARISQAVSEKGREKDEPVFCVLMGPGQGKIVLHKRSFRS
jgi:hypothetical protein